MLILLSRGGRNLNTSLLGIDIRPRVFGLVCNRIMLFLPCGPPFSVQFLTTLVSTLGICGPHIRETLCWFKKLCLVYEGWSRKSGLSLLLDLVLIDRGKRDGDLS